MKKMSRILLLLSITALMVSCKLAVIVVEGGEVQSIGSGTCIASTICIVDVTDPNFAETFTAVPDTGWYFQKWNSGGQFFCGGSTNPTCTLSFQGYEESKEVGDMIASSELFYLMPLFEPYQDIIKVDGKEWLQPYLFTNLSWNDINAVCPAGICAGILNGHNMNGWKWASVEDINALFNYYIGSDVLGTGPDYLSESISVWGPAFFRDGWRPTYSAPNVLRITQGWVNGALGLGDGYLSYLMDVEDTGGFINDELDTRKTPLVSNDVGGWFYRAP